MGDNGLWRVEEALEAATILKGAAAAMVANNQVMLIRNRPNLGPYSRIIPRALWKSWGGCGFL